ncbi:MAG: hypothetical protein QOC98_1976 [Frankiaceae bacterium]|nr:hypothetical protein [Frankiaceae bacterium]
MSERGRHGSAPGPGDLLVRAGAALFAVGVLAVVVMVVPFFTGSAKPPLAVDVLATLTPVGFAIALVGLLVQARADRRS